MSSTPLTSSAFILGSLFVSSFNFFLNSINFDSKYRKYIRAPVLRFLNKDLTSSNEGMLEAGEYNEKGATIWKNGGVSNVMQRALQTRQSLLSPLHSLPLINFLSLIFSLLSFLSLLSFPTPSFLTNYNTKSIPACSFLIAASVLASSLLRITALSRSFVKVKSYSDSLKRRLITTKSIPNFPEIGIIESWVWWVVILLRTVVTLIITALDGGVIRSFIRDTTEGVCEIHFNRAVGAVMDSLDLTLALYLVVRMVVLVWGMRKVSSEGAMSMPEGQGEGNGWRWWVRELGGRKEMWEIVVIVLIVLAGFASWLGEGGVEAFWIPQGIFILILLTIMNYAPRTVAHARYGSSVSTMSSRSGLPLPINTKPLMLQPSPMIHTPNSSISSIRTHSRKPSSFASPPSAPPTGPLPPVPTTARTGRHARGKNNMAVVDFTDEMTRPMTTRPERVDRFAEVKASISTRNDILPGPGSESLNDGGGKGRWGSGLGGLRSIGLSQWGSLAFSSRNPSTAGASPSSHGPATSNPSLPVISPNSPSSEASANFSSNQSEDMPIVSKARLVSSAKKFGIFSKAMEGLYSNFTGGGSENGETRLAGGKVEVEQNVEVRTEAWRAEVETKKGEETIQIPPSPLSSYKRGSLFDKPTPKTPAADTMETASYDNTNSELPYSVKPLTIPTKAFQKPTPQNKSYLTIIKPTVGTHLSEISERTEPTDSIAGSYESAYSGTSLPNLGASKNADFKFSEDPRQSSNRSDSTDPTLSMILEAMITDSEGSPRWSGRKSVASKKSYKNSNLRVDTSLTVPKS